MIVCYTLGVLDSRRNPEAAGWYQDEEGRDFLNLTPSASERPCQTRSFPSVCSWSVCSRIERTAESRGHRPGNGGKEQSCVSPGTAGGEVCHPYLENSPRFYCDSTGSSNWSNLLKLTVEISPRFRLLMADVHDKVRRQRRMIFRVDRNTNKVIKNWVSHSTLTKDLEY